MDSLRCVFYPKGKIHSRRAEEDFNGSAEVDKSKQIIGWYHLVGFLVIEIEVWEDLTCVVKPVVVLDRSERFTRGGIIRGMSVES